MKPFELIAKLVVVHRLAARTGLGSAQLAKAISQPAKQSQIHRYLQGTVLEPQRSTAEGIARLFDIPIDAIYDEAIATQIAIERGLIPGSDSAPSATESGLPLSRQLISSGLIKAPTWIEWGTMDYEKLPEEFLVTAPDDAMADRVLKGHIVRCRKLRPDERPRPGDGIIVEDRAGDWYLRIYSAGPQGRFSAMAKNPLFLPMHDDQDGLRVLAIVLGVPEGRWGQ